MHYKLSPRQIARCRCNDCGVNVIEAGDYCMRAPVSGGTPLGSA